MIVALPPFVALTRTLFTGTSLQIFVGAAILVAGAFVCWSSVKLFALLQTGVHRGKVVWEFLMGVPANEATPKTLGFIEADAEFKTDVHKRFEVVEEHLINSDITMIARKVLGNQLMDDRKADVARIEGLENGQSRIEGSLSQLSDQLKAAADRTYSKAVEVDNKLTKNGGSSVVDAIDRIEAGQIQAAGLAVGVATALAHPTKP